MHKVHYSELGVVVCDVDLDVGLGSCPWFCSRLWVIRAGDIRKPDVEQVPGRLPGGHPLVGPQGPVARVRDIASQLHVGMPSVTAALKALSKRGLVNYDPYQVITLTDRGNELAEEVIRRHEVLRRFLTEVLAMDEESAQTSACRLEHAVTPDLILRLSLLLEFIQQCPAVIADWQSSLDSLSPAGPTDSSCMTCRGPAGPAGAESLEDLPT